MPIVYRSVKGTLLTFAEVDGNFKFLDDKANLKSDKTYVDQALLLKADKTYVDNGLAAKADKTYVDTQVAGLGQSIATKSDKTYVDGQIAQINTALTGKASLSGATFTGPVAGITKAMVGLPNVDDTSDVNKPISDPQALALATKAALNGDSTQDFKVASLNGSFVGGMHNRIINGDMRINQRGIPNSGITAVGYTLDGWAYTSTIGAKISYGPNRYNVATRPPGFPNYLGLGADNGAYNAAATEPFLVQHPIEGTNLSDLQYGTAAAKTCTLTAWVLSNVAGIHSGAILNVLNVKSVVFSFNIPVIGVWTFISIPVPGDPASTINVDNLRGLNIRFNLGSGSNYLRAVTGAWVAGDIAGAIGAVNVLASNAYFLLTGVQFEVGTATPFSRRHISEELRMCQRYFEVGDSPTSFNSAGGATSSAYGDMVFKTTKRAVPTISMTNWKYYSTGTETAFAPGVILSSINRFAFSGQSLTNWYGWAPGGTWSASAEL